MNKSIQPVSLPEVSVKRPVDKARQQNDSDEGVKFDELLPENETAGGTLSETRPPGKALAASGTAHTAAPDLPGEAAQDVLQDAAVSTPVTEPPQPDNTGKQSPQLPLPGIQTAELPAVTGQDTAPPAAGKPQSTAAADLAQSTAAADLLPAPVKPSTVQTELPVAKVTTRVEPSMTREQMQLPVSPVIQASAPPVAETTTELPATTPAAIMSRNAAAVIAAAMHGQGGAKQSPPDGRNVALDLDVPTMRNPAEPGVTDFAATLAAGELKPATARVPVAVGQPGWGRALGEQVVWHVSQNINQANLRLHPQHLGPLEMQVNLDGTQANVTFTSHNALVRDALESALPRLREMLAESGLNLGNVQVSQQGTPEQRRQDAFGSPQAAVTASATDGESETAGNQDRQASAATLLGLVDTYA